MAPTLGNVDFTTVKEDFNSYEIENGQILKVKNILAEIKNVEKDGKIGSQFGMKTISHVITPIPLDTTNMELASPGSVTDKDQIQELKFRPIKLITCIYETKKSILVWETELLHVFLTNKKMKDGEPILRFNSTTEIGLFPKMSYIKSLPPEERKQYEAQVIEPDKEPLT